MDKLSYKTESFLCRTSVFSHAYDDSDDFNVVSGFLNHYEAIIDYYHHGDYKKYLEITNNLILQLNRKNKSLVEAIIKTGFIDFVIDCIFSDKLDDFFALSFKMFVYFFNIQETTTTEYVLHHVKLHERIHALLFSEIEEVTSYSLHIIRMIAHDCNILCVEIPFILTPEDVYSILQKCPSVLNELCYAISKLAYLSRDPMQKYSLLISFPLLFQEEKPNNPHFLQIIGILIKEMPCEAYQILNEDKKLVTNLLNCIVISKCDPTDILIILTKVLKYVPHERHKVLSNIPYDQLIVLATGDSKSSIPSLKILKYAIPTRSWLLNNLIDKDFSKWLYKSILQKNFSLKNISLKFVPIIIKYTRHSMNPKSISVFMTSKFIRVVFDLLHSDSIKILKSVIKCLDQIVSIALHNNDKEIFREINEDDLGVLIDKANELPNTKVQVKAQFVTETITQICN